MTTERERCRVIHKRLPWWNTCPLCGQPITWLRLWDGTYSPCDDEPVMYAFSEKAKYKVVVKRELVERVTLKLPPGAKPRYGRLPHYFSCPVLRKERRAWARANRYTNSERI